MKTLILGGLVLLGWIAVGTFYYTCKTNCRCGSLSGQTVQVNASGNEASGDSGGTSSNSQKKAGSELATGSGSSGGNTGGSTTSAASGNGESSADENTQPRSAGAAGSASTSNEDENEIRLEGKDVVHKQLFCDYKSPHFEQSTDLANYAKDVKAHLAANPGVQVHIIGHTDNVGGKWYNRRLGRERATNFKNFLANEGVPEDRMQVDTEGKAEPIADNTTEAGRKRNRRIEITIK